VPGFRFTANASAADPDPLDGARLAHLLSFVLGWMKSGHIGLFVLNGLSQRTEDGTPAQNDSIEG